MLVMAVITECVCVCVGGGGGGGEGGIYICRTSRFIYKPVCKTYSKDMAPLILHVV